MNKIQQRGKDELEALRLRYREKTAGLVALLAEVITASETSASDEQAGQSVRRLLAERGPAGQLLEECETVVAYMGALRRQELLRSLCDSGAECAKEFTA